MPLGGRLAGKVCLISGSTGIGGATARLAVREGASVFVVSLDEPSCRELSSDLSPHCGFLLADLTVPDSAARAVAQCLGRFERLDAFFHVAGISGRRYGDGPLHECTDEGWRWTIDNNLGTLFLLTRAVLRHFLAQPEERRGAIVLMSSVLAFSPEPRRFATHSYAAAKGAAISLAASLAAYYAPHKIRVNAIAPGLVRTPMSRRAQEDPDVLAYMKVKQPLLEDLLDAEEIARAAVFLMSEEARAITGQTLAVDGGWSVSGT